MGIEVGMVVWVGVGFGLVGGAGRGCWGCRGGVGVGIWVGVGVEVELVGWR